MDAAVVTPTSLVDADEEQQFDLFDNSGSGSRFNELPDTDTDRPLVADRDEDDADAYEQQQHTLTALPVLLEPAARTPLAGDEDQEQEQDQAAPKAPSSGGLRSISSEKASGFSTQAPVEQLLVLQQPDAAAKAVGQRNRAAARRPMGSISQDGGLEQPRTGSSAGSSVKGVPAANAPSTASLSTQALPHIGFETKVSFEAQHELAKSRSSRFQPRLSSARNPDSRVQGRVTRQLTVTGVLVEEPRPIDFRLQAFAPRPPKRNTRESVRPERFGGQHYHLARARTDSHTRPRSRGDTHSPNLDDLELAHIPVVASRIARTSSFLDGSNGIVGFGASSNGNADRTRSPNLSSKDGFMPTSALPRSNGSTEKSRRARLEDRPSFNTRVRLARPFTCKRLAATNARPGVAPFESTRPYEFREVPKARSFGMEEFDARFEKDPLKIKFKSRSLDTMHMPSSASICFRDANDSLWTDPIVRHSEAHKKLFLPRMQWPDRFQGTTRHRLQWRDPRQAFLERVEEVVAPVWASQQLTGRESPVAVLPLSSARPASIAAGAPIAARPLAATARV